MLRLPSDRDLLTLSCTVGATALLASASQIGAATSPACALAASSLDLVAALFLLHAVHRVGPSLGRGVAIAEGVWLAAARELGSTAIRVELCAIRALHRQRLLLAAIALGGGCGLILCERPDEAPDGWIMAIGGLAALASGAPLRPLCTLGLVVDVGHRRVTSSAGVFVLAAGTCLHVTVRDGAAVLVVHGTPNGPALVSAPDVGREQLRDVAHTLAVLLDDVEVLRARDRR